MHLIRYAIVLVMLHPNLQIGRVGASDREVRVVAVVEPSLLAIFGAMGSFADRVTAVGHVAFLCCIVR
jgi:hypothetical protein